jgi:hypothetical protein
MLTPQPDAPRTAEVLPAATFPATDHRGDPDTPTTPPPPHDFEAAFRAACARGVAVAVGRSRAPARRYAGVDGRNLVAQTAAAIGVPASYLRIFSTWGSGGRDAHRRRTVASALRTAIQEASIGVIVASGIHQLARTAGDFDLLLDDAAQHDVWLYLAGRAVRPADPTHRLVLRIAVLQTGDLTAG